MLALLVVVVGVGAISYWWQPRVLGAWRQWRAAFGLNNGQLQFMGRENTYIARPSFMAWWTDPDTTDKELHLNWETDPKVTMGQLERHYTDALLQYDKDGDLPLWEAPSDHFGFFYSNAYRVNGMPSGGWLTIPAPYVRLHLGWPVALLAAWVALRVWRWRKREGMGKYACRWCGYDLRATPVRCPECGNVAAPVTGGQTPRQQALRAWRHRWIGVDLLIRRNVVWLALASFVVAFGIPAMISPQPTFLPVKELKLGERDGVTYQSDRSKSDCIVIHDLSDLDANLRAGIRMPEIKDQQLTRMALFGDHMVVFGSAYEQVWYTNQLNEIRSAP